MNLRIPALAACAWLWLGACDPVHGDATDALGGEASGVRPGPTHRPGQPCLWCHDGALGDPSEFSVAGTVFLQASGRDPAQGASVELRGADDAVFTLTTNQAGNFYVSPNRFKPTFPLESKVHYEGQTATMHSLIGREGACGACHSDPPGPGSSGHVYVFLDDGGVPP